MSSTARLEGFEARLSAENGTWVADVEAQGADHLRLRFRTPVSGNLPRWVPGTALTCVLKSETDTIFAEVSLLKCASGIAWITCPAHWEDWDRRSARREVGGFLVQYTIGSHIGSAECVNVSAGGIRLRMPFAVQKGTKARVSFALPGSDEQVTYGALAVQVDGDEVGFKLTGLAPHQGLRIVDSMAA